MSKSWKPEVFQQTSKVGLSLTVAKRQRFLVLECWLEQTVHLSVNLIFLYNVRGHPRDIEMWS